MNTTLIVTGSIFAAAAIVRIGLEGFGIKIPALEKAWQQWSLLALGLVVMALGAIPAVSPLIKNDPGYQPNASAPTGNPSGSSPSQPAPSVTNSTAVSASKNIPLTSVPVVGSDNNGYTVGTPTIAGGTYKNSLIASDSCEDYGTITYQVAKKYKYLHALVGVSGGSSSSGESFNFSVSIDNDDAAPGEAGPAMNANESPQPITVNIVGASRITLWAVTSDCGDYGDAVWINPTLSN